MWFWGCSGTSPVCRHAHVAEYSEPSDASFAVATERPGVSPSTVSLSQSACSRGLIRHTFEGADRSVVNIVVMYMEDVRKFCFYTCIDSMAIDFDPVVFVPSPWEVGNWWNFPTSSTSSTSFLDHSWGPKAVGECQGHTERQINGSRNLAAVEDSVRVHHDIIHIYPYNFPCFSHVSSRFSCGKSICSTIRPFASMASPWGTKAAADGRLEHALKLAMQERWWRWWVKANGSILVPQFLAGNAGNADKWMVIPQKCWAHRF